MMQNEEGVHVVKAAMQAMICVCEGAACSQNSYHYNYYELTFF